MKKSILFFLLVFIASFIQAQTVKQTTSKQDTVTTEDGLKYIVLDKGNGDKAEAGMEVAVNYSGYLLDGKEFDSSYKRGKPIKFVLGQGQVIRGWDEGIALMHVGDKFRLIIPPELGYGERAAGMIPANSTLIFDTQLMSVEKPKLSLADTLLMAIFSKGVDSAVTKFHEIMKTDSSKYNLDEDALSTLGYKLMRSNYKEPAVKILELNAEIHPKSANVFVTLAQAYMYLGENKKAEDACEKALKNDPKDARAEEMLTRLKSEK